MIIIVKTNALLTYEGNYVQPRSISLIIDKFAITRYSMNSDITTDLSQKGMLLTQARYPHRNVYKTDCLPIITDHLQAGNSQLFHNVYMACSERRVSGRYLYQVNRKTPLIESYPLAAIPSHCMVVRTCHRHGVATTGTNGCAGTSFMQEGDQSTISGMPYLQGFEHPGVTTLMAATPPLSSSNFKLSR
jgi:hypothetical protein